MSYSIATAELQYSNYCAALQFSSSGAWRCDAQLYKEEQLDIEEQQEDIEEQLCGAWHFCCDSVLNP